MKRYLTESIGAVLAGNAYPGRGIIIGKTPDGAKACVAYFIMGRSANSRNRVFRLKDGALFTEPFDADKVEDARLIIYNALARFENKLIVTNGDQTETVLEGLKKGIDFAQSLACREFEPDAPNYTPRISGMLTFENGDFHYQMSILKSADEQGSACVRHHFSYPAIAGVGHLLHTYACDGNPLPPFCGEPKRVKIGSDVSAFALEVWNALDEENRISLFVCFTDVTSGESEEIIINKNS